MFDDDSDEFSLTSSASRGLQEEKVYVQHRIRENSKLLWELIANQKACFYIAGWV